MSFVACVPLVLEGLTAIRDGPERKVEQPATASFIKRFAPFTGVHSSTSVTFVHSAGTGVIAVSTSGQTLASMNQFMNAAYVAAYATARSSLAALADQTHGENSIRYERALLALDRIHGGVFPATYPVVGTRRDLLLWFQGAVEHMIVLDGDGLALELLLGDVFDL